MSESSVLNELDVKFFAADSHKFHFSVDYFYEKSYCF